MGFGIAADDMLDVGNSELADCFLGEDELGCFALHVAWIPPLGDTAT